MEAFKNTMIQVFVPVLCVLLTAGFGYGTAWLRKKLQEAHLGVWDKAASTVMDELDTAVTKFQPLVDEMKEKAKDGTLDESQVALLKAKAIDYVKTQLAPMGVDVLKVASSEMLGDWVTSIVEAKKRSVLVAVPVPPAVGGSPARIDECSAPA